MKRFKVLTVCLILLFLAVSAESTFGGSIHTIRLRPLNASSRDGVGAGTTTVASGTSYFRTLNLNNVQGHGAVDFAGVGSGASPMTFGILEMDAAAELKAQTGITDTASGASSAVSGITVSFYYRQASQDLSDSQWSLQEKRAIIENMTPVAGNTRYLTPIPLTLRSQFLRLEVATGLSGVECVIGLTFQNP